MNLSLTALNGIINVEPRTDGGIGIYYETIDPHNTIMINHDQMVVLTRWLVNYSYEQSQKRKG